MHSEKKPLVIYWVRRDFRLTDNPALFEASEFSIKNKIPFLPVFVLDPGILKTENNIGYPRRLFLSKILADFSTKFPKFEIFFDNPVNIFEELSRYFNVQLYFNNDLEPYARKRDFEIKNLLEKNSSKVFIFADQNSVSLETRTQTGNVYTVFTPFKNAVLNSFLTAKACPKVDTKNLNYLEELPQSLHIKLMKPNSSSFQQEIFSKINSTWEVSFGQNKAINLDEIFERPNLESWYFTEEKALEKFNLFIQNKVSNYNAARDYLGLDIIDGGQTSQISMALKWGLVSARTLKNITLQKYPDAQLRDGVSQYISELIWREFYRYILYNFPNVMNSEFQPKFRNKITWVDENLALERFKKWILGQTGYALVDACMEQVRQTGWMHNRGRMLVGSILTKNLGVDWRWGQDYFRAVLLDLDEASNNGGWQWAASVGADPKPIRIFNPYLQAEKYDSKNDFTKYWLPKNYNIQTPIIEHPNARQEAMERYGLDKKAPARDF